LNVSKIVPVVLSTSLPLYPCVVNTPITELIYMVDLYQM
jgi:hypothetical protein